MGAGFGNFIVGDPIALVAVLAVIAVVVWAFYHHPAHGQGRHRRPPPHRRSRNPPERSRSGDCFGSPRADHLARPRRHARTHRRLHAWRRAAAGDARGAARFRPLAGTRFGHGAGRSASRSSRTPANPSTSASVRSSNELLEADGRTAGGLATLRFRPLAGERRNVAALAHDAHKLGKQVERLSAVLDAAPLAGLAARMPMAGSPGSTRPMSPRSKRPTATSSSRPPSRSPTAPSIDKSRANPKHRLRRPHPRGDRRRHAGA